MWTLLGVVVVLLLAGCASVPERADRETIHYMFFSRCVDGGRISTNPRRYQRKPMIAYAEYVYPRPKRGDYDACRVWADRVTWEHFKRLDWLDRIGRCS